MIQKFTALAEAAAVNLGAIALLWALFIATGYVMARWCFEQPIAWQKIIKWVSIAMGIVFICTVLMYILPEYATIPLTKVFVPYLICAIALHSFLLAVDRYMRHRHGEGIIQTRLVVAIITIYVVAILASLGMLKLHVASLIELSDIAVGYLTRTSIVALLVLEVIGGRCKEKSEGADSATTSTSSYSSRW